MQLYYAPTQDMEVYTSDQVTTYSASGEWIRRMGIRRRVALSDDVGCGPVPGKSSVTCDNSRYPLPQYIHSLSFSRADGSMEITISKGVGTGITQNYEGEVTSVSMAFTSGMVTSWNKFCFTGERVVEEE